MPGKIAARDTAGRIAEVCMIEKVEGLKPELHDVLRAWIWKSRRMAKSVVS